MDWNTEDNKRLIDAILSLKTPEEAQHFLRDLMTENEIKEFTKRLSAAIMLANEMPYSEIKKQTGISSTTVARVSLWLNKSEDGYKNIIKKLNNRVSVPQMKKD